MQILNRNFRIKYVDVIQGAEPGELILGNCDFDKAIITIMRGLSPELEKETIMHEVLHGIIFQLGQAELACDEVLISGLSKVLLMKWKEIDKILYKKKTPKKKKVS